MDEFIHQSEELLGARNVRQERIFLDEAREFLTSEYSHLLLRLDSSFDADETKEVVSNLCDIALKPSIFEHGYEAFGLLHKVHTEDRYVPALDNDYPDIQAMIVPVYLQVAPRIITHMSAAWLNNSLPNSDGDLLDNIIRTHAVLQQRASVGANPDGPKLV